MLYITRLTNESIMIGEEIEIKVSRIEGVGVCLGIQAPRELAISRKESLKKIKSIMTKQKSLGKT